VGAAFSVAFVLGCDAAVPDGGAEYPALVMPARLPPAATGAPAKGTATEGAPAPTPVSPTPGRLTRETPSIVPDAPAAPGAPAQPATADGGTAGSSAQAPGPEPTQRSSHGDLPDPKPLSERAQWSYPVTYDRGAVLVGAPELICLPRAQSTARRIGRFAFELWLGRELVDRVRFDFPLLASEEPASGARRPIHDTPRFAPGARVSVVLRVPASERAARASILDRATGQVIDVTWPPRSASGAPLARACPAAPARG